MPPTCTQSLTIAEFFKGISKMKYKTAVVFAVSISIISFLLACKDKEVKVDSDKEIIVLIEEPSKSYYRQGPAG